MVQVLDSRSPTQGIPELGVQTLTQTLLDMHIVRRPGRGPPACCGERGKLYWACEIHGIQESGNTFSAYWVEGRSECQETREIEIVTALYSVPYFLMLTREKMGGYDSSSESVTSMAAAVGGG